MNATTRNFEAENLYRQFVAADTAAAFWRGFNSEHATEREAFYQAKSDAFYAQYQARIAAQQ